jgi:proteasome accessory factor C
MVAPKYAQRIARLPAVFEQLAAHPDGLPLDELAGRFRVSTDELRQDLLAFFTADVAVLLGLSRPHVLEFLGAEGDEEDPNEAGIVRIVDERPTDELGVEYVDASELALVYTAAHALLEIEPEDKDLAAAIDVLTETMVGEPLPQDAGAVWNRPLEPLQEAAQRHRRVRIDYSRSWQVGVIDRVVDPYRLVQTRRGWEVDAGPPDEDGRLRTYLLSNIRSFEVLDDTFEPPADLPVLLEQQRTTKPVQVRLPHSARWAADMYAEQVTVVDDDEATVVLDLDLLPPLEHRVGLLLLASGPDAAVLEPARLVAAGPALASELLAHHRG